MRILLVCCALVLGACGSRGEMWERPLRLSAPVVAGDRLVVLNEPASILVAIDPATGEAPLAIDVLDFPRALVPVPGGVLITGGRGDDPALDVVSLPAGEVKRIPVHGAYDRIATSADGRHALLFFDPAARPAPGGPAARNQNEVTVVDLAAGTATAIGLRTEALAPQDALFAPDGTLAAVLLDNAVALIDPADPQVHVQVPLKLPGGASLRPQEAIFSPDGGFLYVRTADVADVVALEIVRGEGRLDVALNFLFLPGAAELRDILVPEGEDFGGSVLALWKGAAALLDARGDTSRLRSTPTAEALDSIADLGEGRVLLYAARNSPVVAGWDPLGARYEEDRLAGPLVAEPRFASGQAWLPHGATGGGDALTAAAVEVEGARLRVRLRPILLDGTPTATAIGEDGVLWAAVNVQDDDGLTGAVVAIDPVTLAPSGATLDETIDILGIVGGHVYAWHPSDEGDVTFLPVDDLRREAAIRYDGLVGAGLLDRGDH